MKIIGIVLAVIVLSGCATKPPKYLCQPVAEMALGCVPLDENGEIIK